MARRRRFKGLIVTPVALALGYGFVSSAFVQGTRNVSLARWVGRIALRADGPQVAEAVIESDTKMEEPDSSEWLDQLKSMRAGRGAHNFDDDESEELPSNVLSGEELAKQVQDDNAIVQAYLKDEIGMSWVELTKVLNMWRFAMPGGRAPPKARAEAVVDFFTSEVGLNQTQLRRVLSVCPNTMTVYSIETLREKIRFLEEDLGVPAPNVPELVVADPQIFNRNILTVLRPCVDFWVDDVGLTLQELAELLKTQPSQIWLDPEKLKPKWRFAQEVLGATIQQVFASKTPYFRLALDKTIAPRHFWLLQKGVTGVPFDTLIFGDDAIFCKRAAKCDANEYKKWITDDWPYSEEARTLAWVRPIRLRETKRGRWPKQQEAAPPSYEEEEDPENAELDRQYRAMLPRDGSKGTQRTKGPRSREDRGEKRKPRENRAPRKTFSSSKMSFDNGEDEGSAPWEQARDIREEEPPLGEESEGALPRTAAAPRTSERPVAKEESEEATESEVKSSRPAAVTPDDVRVSYGTKEGFRRVRGGDGKWKNVAGAWRDPKELVRDAEPQPQEERSMPAFKVNWNSADMDDFIEDPNRPRRRPQWEERRPPRRQQEESWDQGRRSPRGAASSDLPDDFSDDAWQARQATSRPRAPRGRFEAEPQRRERNDYDDEDDDDDWEPEEQGNFQQERGNFRQDRSNFREERGGYGNARGREAAPRRGGPAEASQEPWDRSSDSARRYQAGRGKRSYSEEGDRSEGRQTRSSAPRGRERRDDYDPRRRGDYDPKYGDDFDRGLKRRIEEPPRKEPTMFGKGQRLRDNQDFLARGGPMRRSPRDDYLQNC